MWRTGLGHRNMDDRKPQEMASTSDGGCVPQSLLQKILKSKPKLGRAERRVAELVHAKPDEVIHMSIASLSERCSVSDPTIIRFCRRFGYQGYQDFKVHLAQDLVPSAPFDYQKITAEDSVDVIVRKTCQNSLNAIQRAMDDIQPERIAEAADRIHASDWVAILASGISEGPAIDAEHKFQRLGLRCTVVQGRTKQRLQVGFASADETFLVFSQSGATRQLVECAEIARSRGGVVISVTAADSPLARVSDTVIGVTPYERTELMTPLASRLNHYLVVNMLVTAIAVSTGNAFPDQLPALDSWVTEKVPDFNDDATEDRNDQG